MPHQLIIDLQAGITLKQFFIIRRLENRLTKDGKRFLALRLGDKSGVIKAMVWEETLRKCPFPLAPCDFVGITGQVESFQGELQVNVTYIEPVESIRRRGGDLQDFDPELLILATDYNREELWRELWELASGLNPPLQELVLSLLQKYQTPLMTWPGAESVHHAYFGGLLEHTWSVARHAVRAAEVYPELNRDLVLAGAILHDLGKIKELASPQCPQRTIPGGLVGHIVLGWEMVREEAAALGFPDEDLLRELEHIIISHHGSQEYGSPVLPMTPEALLVYYLDEIDAKLFMARHHLEMDAGDGDFTTWHHLMERRFYKGRNLREKAAADQSEPQTE